MWKLTTACDQGRAVKLSEDITFADINELSVVLNLKPQAHKAPAWTHKSSSRLTFDL